jgi:succinyl-diaminopimelate desuccinylase
MKGGLAVMLELASKARERRCDTTYVFYAREEIARVESGLLEIEAGFPRALHCDVAVMLEPTGAIVEAGCQGSLRFEIILRGVRAHSARPWTGRNAIHRLGALIETVDAFGDRRPLIDGCEYRESLQIVGISGGGATNVVPDEARLILNYRYAPDKSLEEAISFVESSIGAVIDPQAGDVVSVLDAAPAAPPNLSDPVLERLVRGTGHSPRAKLAWTDVAFFAERGIPAANFGPGDPLLAHRADEFVDQQELWETFKVLDALLDEVS